MSALFDLADTLSRRIPTTQLMMGTVTAVSADTKTVSVRVGGTSTDETPDIIEGVPRLTSYTSPSVGDVVLLVADDEEEVIIGQIA